MPCSETAETNIDNDNLVNVSVVDLDLEKNQMGHIWLAPK